MRKEWPIYTPHNISDLCRGGRGEVCCTAHCVRHHHHHHALHPIITSLAVFSGAKYSVEEDAVARFDGYKLQTAIPETCQKCCYTTLYVRVLPLLLSFAPVVSALINIRFMAPKTPFLGRARKRERERERERRRKRSDMQEGNSAELALNTISIWALT